MVVARRGAGDALSGDGRVGDMTRRLERRLEQAGFAPATRTPILDTVTAALELRARSFGDEHFETLHPGRTLLVLLDDCAVLDAGMLEAAASLDSEHPELRAPPGNELAGQVPMPDRAEDRLLEELLVTDHPVRLIALAERLDHARHLHLREPSRWQDFHRGIGAVYAPVATRTNERLARRYDWWWHTFRRRFLDAPLR